MTFDVRRDERGSILLAGVGALLVFALLGVSVIHIGNWLIHRRHLQMQTDAAALAAGQAFDTCISDPSGAAARMQQLATQYGGFSGTAYNLDRANPSAGTVQPPNYNRLAYPDPGGPTPDSDFADSADPCTAGLFDVKATESNVRLLPIPGTIHAHSRVELRVVNELTGLLPLAVPDPRFQAAYATFVDEKAASPNTPVAGCANSCTVQLLPAGTDAQGRQLWSANAPLSVPINSSDIGVRIRLQANASSGTACGVLYSECFTDPATMGGLLHIRGWSSGTAPLVKDAWLLTGTCSAASGGYFTTGDCSIGVQANVDLGAAHPISTTANPPNAHVWATIDGGNTKYQLTRGALVAGTTYTWTLNTGIPVAGAGPHTIGLSWDWKDPNPACNGPACTDKGTFGTVQRTYEGSPTLSGPIQDVDVFETTSLNFPANSFQAGTTHNLGVTLASSGTLQVQSKATDPVIQLRVEGSQNQSIDCDPALPKLEDEIHFGCGPSYAKNPDLTCPAYNVLWNTPQPWKCVKTQTGSSVGQVEHGFEERILGSKGSNTCTAPIHWPYDEELYPNDTRVVDLVVVPYGTFSGSGNDVVPVIDFGAFYITGWNTDPCPGHTPTPKSFVSGHFIKYIPRNSNNFGTAHCYLTDPNNITPCVAVLTR